MKRATEIRKQLQKYAQRFQVPSSSTSDIQAIQKCLVAGYFANAARLQPDGMYKTIRGQHVRRTFNVCHWVEELISHHSSV